MFIVYLLFFFFFFFFFQVFGNVFFFFFFQCVKISINKPSQRITLRSVSSRVLSMCSVVATSSSLSKLLFLNVTKQWIFILNSVTISLSRCYRCLCFFFFFFLQLEVPYLSFQRVLCKKKKIQKTNLM